MDLLNDLISELNFEKITEIMIGVYTTLVVSRNGGFATTLTNVPCKANRLSVDGSIIGKDVKSVARLSLSENLLEASVGMAALNSGLDVQRGEMRQINARELIVQKGEGKIAGVIGHFPFLERVRSAFRNLYIFEKNPREGDFQETDIPKYLPEADVVAITGTAITNHTIKSILSARQKGCYTIVLGPTTPLSPVLFDYGIDAVCGALAKDIPLVFSGIREAQHFRHLKGVDYLTLFKE